MDRATHGLVDDVVDNLVDNGVYGVRTVVDPTAVIDASLLWDDVVVEAGVTVHGCIVTDGVRLPAGSTWRGATVRVASGSLCPEERLVGDLAVGPLGPAT